MGGLDQLSGNGRVVAITVGVIYKLARVVMTLEEFDAFGVLLCNCLLPGGDNTAVANGLTVGVLSLLLDRLNAHDLHEVVRRVAHFRHLVTDAREVVDGPACLVEVDDLSTR